MKLSQDSLALLLICSSVGLSKTTEYRPFTLKEWNILASKLKSLSLRPSDLLGLTSEELKKKVGLSDKEAERLLWLMDRSGALAIELERLHSLGIWVLTRADAEYPAKYKQRLKDLSPAILFYAGDKALLGQPGIAVVGSRHLNEVERECAEVVGSACGVSGLVLYSGGAKGADSISMKSALDNQGAAVGVLADSLERAIREPQYRAAINRGDLCLVAPYSPNVHFSIGAAMGRNKLIYALADYAIVIASNAQKGGTWAGATEALKAKWVPVFVLEHSQMPQGNILLIKNGAYRLPYPFPVSFPNLKAWLDNYLYGKQVEVLQPSLF